MSTPKCLDEMSLRREGFRDGYPVKLADGQEWTFPRPRLRFRPARGKDGKFALAGGWEHDEIYGELRDELLETDSEDLFSVLSISSTIACHLLLINYALSDDDLGALLPVDLDDDSNSEMWTALTPIVLASPKGLGVDG